MKKLDKKQIPQFAALCLLSAGTFGYFVVKIVTPSPAAAGTRPHPVTGAASSALAAAPASAKRAGVAPAGEAEGSKVGTGADAVPAEDETGAPAPTPGMRDPFVVGYVDPKTALVPALAPALPAVPGKLASPLTKSAKSGNLQVASIHEIGPAPVGLPTLPFGLKGLSPLGSAPAPAAAPLPAISKKVMPAAPPAPSWTVTGVLQNETGQLAVLRSGEARRIVHTGDFVDSVYRVVTVTRSAVILRHGKTFYHLTLGAAKPAAPAAVKTMLPAVPAFSPVPVSSPEPVGTALGTAGYSARPEMKLAQLIQAALLLAHSYMAPAQAEVDVCLAAFHARRSLPPRVAMRFLDGSVPASGSHAALVHLERGKDLYHNGKRAEGRAQWRCVLAMDDLTAADEAGKLLDHYN